MGQFDTKTIVLVTGSSDGDRKIGCETLENEEFKAEANPNIADSSEFESECKADPNILSMFPFFATSNHFHLLPITTTLD